MEGGAHPDTDVNVRGLALSSPTVKDTVTSYEIGYPALDSKTRARHVESSVARILTDGRYSPSRNGYKITEISGKYEGDSGIDGLFRVTLNKKYFYLCVESKYSKTRDFSFGSGVRISSNKYAKQMSEAWIRIVAYNLAKKIERDNHQYADNFDYACLQEIIANPSDVVIRALATGDRTGNLKICCLAGYENSEYDNQYLTKMFS